MTDAKILNMIGEPFQVNILAMEDDKVILTIVSHPGTIKENAIIFELNKNQVHIADPPNKTDIGRVIGQEKR